MVTRFRLKAPTPAILDKPGGEHVLVTLPADAVLEQEQSFQFSTTLLGWSLYIGKGGITPFT
jgi:hypothetical protein